MQTHFQTGTSGLPPAVSLAFSTDCHSLMPVSSADTGRSITAACNKCHCIWPQQAPRNAFCMLAAVLMCYKDGYMQHKVHCWSQSNRLRFPVAPTIVLLIADCQSTSAPLKEQKAEAGSRLEGESDWQTRTSIAIAPPCPRSGRVACAQSPTPLRQPSNQGSPGITCLHM